MDRKMSGNWKEREREKPINLRPKPYFLNHGPLCSITMGLILMYCIFKGLDHF
jgi:hypothetical protein